VDWRTLASILAVGSVGVAATVGVIAEPLGHRLGLLDFPDLAGGRKRHARITPLVGGTGLVPVVVLATLLTARILTDGPYARAQFSWLAGCVAAMFLIGLADDRFALGPKVRLLLAVLALSIGIVHAPDLAIGFVRFGGQSTTTLATGWGDAFTLLCLVGLLNAVNMADGKNGIVIGLGLIWSVILWFRLPPVALPIAASAFAALAVLMWFNLRGRLFLGDGGSYAISALFGLLAIYAYNHDFAALRADDIAVMFAVPVFDTIRLMVVRAYARRSPFEGDRNHLHHHLHRRFGWPRGLWLYLAIVAGPNLGALLWPGTGMVWLLVTLLLYVATLVYARIRAGEPA